MVGTKILVYLKRQQQDSTVTTYTNIPSSLGRRSQVTVSTSTLKTTSDHMSKFLEGSTLGNSPTHPATHPLTQRGELISPRHGAACRGLHNMDLDALAPLQHVGSTMRRTVAKRRTANGTTLAPVGAAMIVAVLLITRHWSSSRAADLADSLQRRQRLAVTSSLWSDDESLIRCSWL